MATEKSRNLQEIFLNNVRKSHAAVTVFLVNGVKLQGIITCLLYTSPSPRDAALSRMPSSA